MDWTIKFTDVVIAVCTVIGPIAAVQAQKFIERSRESHGRRQWIFTSLMSNRATRLHDDYVKALNLIDLEFAPRRFADGGFRAVRDAWRELFGELVHGLGDGEQDLNQLRAWNARCDERLVDLLAAMSSALGHSYSREDLRRGIYYPKGRADLETAQLNILHGLREVIDGRRSLPMVVTGAPGAEELAALQRQLTEKMALAYTDNGALKVEISER